MVWFGDFMTGGLWLYEVNAWFLTRTLLVFCQIGLGSIKLHRPVYLSAWIGYPDQRFGRLGSAQRGNFHIFPLLSKTFSLAC